MLAGALLLSLLASPIGVAATASAETLVGNNPGDTGRPVTTSLTGNLNANTVLDRIDLSLSDSLRFYSATATSDATRTTGIYNSGSLGATLDLKTTRFQLREGFGYGKQDFSVLSQAVPVQVDPNAPPQPARDRLPVQRFLPSYSSVTSLTVDQAFSRLLRATGSLSFSVGGGIGAEARGILPWQQNLGASLSGGWRLSPFDAVTASLNASFGRADLGLQSRAIGGSLGWGRRLDSDSSGSLSLGAAMLSNQVGVAVGAGSGASTVTVVNTLPVPTLDAGLQHSFPVGGERLAFNFRASALPGFDLLTGALYLRGASHLGCSWSPNQQLSFGASISGDRVLSGVLSGAWGAGADVSAVLHLGREAGFRLSYRSAILTPTTFLLPDEDVPKQWAISAGFFIGVHDRL